MADSKQDTPVFRDSKIDDGGLAFPLFEEGPYSHVGMFLRDYIATASLSGMLSHSTRYRPRTGSPENWHEAIAQEAYQIADAMIAARRTA